MSGAVFKVRDEISAHNDGVTYRVRDKRIGLYLLTGAIEDIQNNIDEGGRPQPFELLKRPRYIPKKSKKGPGRTGTGRGPVGILYWTGDLWRSVGSSPSLEYSGDEWEITVGSGAGIPYFGYQHGLRPFHFVPQEQLHELMLEGTGYLILDGLL